MEGEVQLFADLTLDSTVRKEKSNKRTCLNSSLVSVIVDASDGCATVNIFLAGTATVTRALDIKVNQYDCSPDNLGGPSGCLQYFTGTTGQIASFNFDTTTTTVSASGISVLCLY